MKRANWAYCAAISLLCVLGAVWAVTFEGVPLRLTHMSHQAELAPLDVLERSIASSLPEDAWTSSALPFRHHWNYWYKAQAPISWHRFDWHQDQVPAAGVAVYVPNFAGRRLVLYANDRWVDATPEGMNDPGRYPWLFRIPPGLLKAGDNHFLIAIRPEISVTVLSPVEVGRFEALHQRYETRLWWSKTGPQVVCITVALAGVLVFAFWLGRRSETAYLYYALGAGMWVVRTSHYFFDTLPFDSRWYWWMVLNTLPWLMAFVYMFAMRVHREHLPWLERAMLGIAFVLTVATMPAWEGQRWNMWGIYQAAYQAQLALAVLATGLITRMAWRRRSVESITLMLALWFNLALGINDMLVKNDYQYLEYEGFYLMPYGALLLFFSLSIGAVLRFLASLEEVELLNRSLEQRVRDKAQELEATYQQLSIAERERAAADERTRLMREMHDGLGSSLMTSLKMVEGGQLTQQQIADVLRECIDDLRLIIDSLEPLDQELLSLLATLRYRLGHRLAAAGVELEWAVSDIPSLTWLDQTAALQIMRTVQEILTNALKHANPHRIRLETGAEGGDVYVRISDDGPGFDVAAARARGLGRGLQNLMRRADALGGRINIDADVAGTRVTLWLPVSSAR